MRFLTTSETVAVKLAIPTLSWDCLTSWDTSPLNFPFAHDIEFKGIVLGDLRPEERCLPNVRGFETPIGTVFGLWYGQARDPSDPILPYFAGITIDDYCTQHIINYSWDSTTELRDLLLAQTPPV